MAAASSGEAELLWISILGRGGCPLPFLPAIYSGMLPCLRFGPSTRLV